MSRNALSLRRPRAADMLARRRSRLESLRVTLPDSARTTIHVASYDLTTFRPRIVLLEHPAPLVRWCKQQGIRDAIVGGFFIRSRYAPLGELQIDGQPRDTVPFAAPWGDLRACVQIDQHIRIARRDALVPLPGGDLLQAGPMLVAGGRRAFEDGDDQEGFAAGSHQFDSDITDGRYPRAALALAGDRLLAVACDGRTRRDAGMTLSELAGTLIELGASDALNLDGGGSASLVYAGRLRNRPREEHGVDLLDGRPILSAIVLESP
ncbi:MAG TPA: phosphodiester glycosidase family protein [Solirubrobacteraceae bacterium]